MPYIAAYILLRGPIRRPREPVYQIYVRDIISVIDCKSISLMANPRLFHYVPLRKRCNLAVDGIVMMISKEISGNFDGSVLPTYHYVGSLAPSISTGHPILYSPRSSEGRRCFAQSITQFHPSV